MSDEAVREVMGIREDSQARPHRIALALILGVGVALRLREYLFARSLWTDEASLALNILERGYGGLLGRLDYDQGAPPGFLLLERAFSDVLGPGELALRLLPLLSGVAALGLTYLVGRRLVGERGALLATGLCAVMRPAIYYSAEVKQYSTDMAVALFLLWLGARTIDESVPGRRYIALALAGGIAMWFSHAAMIVMAGLGVVLMARAIHVRSMATARWLAVPALVWVASFVPLYLFSLSHLVANEYLHDFWVGTYAPLLPASPADVHFYHTALFALLDDAVGPHGGALALLGLLLGTVTLLDHEEGRWKWALLVSPIAVSWLLSGFELYPFFGRMVLFVLPPILLIVAPGMVAVWERSRILGACAGLALLATPVLLAAGEFRHPSGREEIRPVLERVHGAIQSEDRLLVYYGAQHPFEYYSRHGDIGALPPASFIQINRDDWRAYEQRLEELSEPGRAWIVFAHVYAGSGTGEEDLLLFMLDGLGTRLDSVPGDGASAYLYDFGG